jgi:N-acetylneuraminic acid mutarotase
MKALLKISTCFFISACILFSCSKPDLVHNNPGDPQPPPPPPSYTPFCNSRQVINALLVPVGSLSAGRIGLVSATAGSKILFAGGSVQGAYSSRVDIYDTLSKTWTKAELTIPERQGMVAATVGHKIFFAGGNDADWFDVTARVDVYNAITDAWSTAELSEPRAYLAAVTVANKIYFAGGAKWNSFFRGSRTVDVYDNETDTWSVMQLSEGRYELTATAVGNKIYFAGGINDIHTISSTVDILDIATGSWTVKQLSMPRTGHASIATGNNIIYAGGASSSYWNGYTPLPNVELTNIHLDTSILICFNPGAKLNPVLKNEHIIFFPGSLSFSNPNAGTPFEIYNTTTDSWFTGILNKPVYDAAIISVNNTVYVAGGRDNAWGPYFKEVWKLEF